jgi:hypothetical protein
MLNTWKILDGKMIVDLLMLWFVEGSSRVEPVLLRTRIAKAPSKGPPLPLENYYFSK